MRFQGLNQGGYAESGSIVGIDINPHADRHVFPVMRHLGTLTVIAISAKAGIKYFHLVLDSGIRRSDGFGAFISIINIPLEKGR